MGLAAPFDSQSNALLAETVSARKHAAADDSSTFEVGEVIGGRYRVLGVLGRGGMGEVFEAEHLELRAKVAIKVLRMPRGRLAAEQLSREARITASLATENVVRVSDCGTLMDGSPYVVMERLYGTDLQGLLAEKRRLPVQLALRIALEICRGLEDLHAAQIIHRDIKPANVFVLSPKGLNRCRCKILDLGISSYSSHHTPSPLLTPGSLRFMAPEQLTDPASVTDLADIYAVGVVLYRCLTGSVPHDGESGEEIALSILNRGARPVAQLRPEVSPALSALVMQTIARPMESRPKSARALARSLRSLLRPARTLQPHSTSRVLTP